MPTPLLLLPLSLIRTPAVEGADATVFELREVEKCQAIKKKTKDLGSIPPMLPSALYRLPSPPHHVSGSPC